MSENGEKVLQGRVYHRFGIFTIALTLLSREWKMLQITHSYGVKLLAWKSGGVNFWTNIMSVSDFSLKSSVKFSISELNVT